MTFLLKTQVSACVKRTKQKQNDDDEDEKEKQKKLLQRKESAPLENNKHSSLSLLRGETNTPNARREKAVFSRKDKKKSQISRHKTDPRRHFILT
jgi:hypothetical protein